MAKPGVTVISSFTYRGATEEVSNQFHFTGSAPSDAAGWNALCAQFVTLFKALIPGVTTVRRVYCYSDTDNDSVYQYNLADHGGVVTGTANPSSYTKINAGDAAYWVRWSTGRFNSKGKAIYLRKYLHPAYGDTSNSDALEATQKAAALAGATALIGATGSWPGIAGPTYDLTSPAASVSTYITTRTLKRRGKRP